MYMFQDDEAVVPKYSGWFAELNTTTGDVTSLRDRPLYKEDWLGLQALDKKGGLVLELLNGSHMQLDEADLRKTFKTYFGPPRTKRPSAGESQGQAPARYPQAEL